MENERSSVVSIGGMEYELILITKATKAIAGGVAGWRTWAKTDEG